MSQQRRRPARTRAATVQRPRTARPSPVTSRETQTPPVDTSDAAIAPVVAHAGDRSGVLAQVVALGIVVWLVIVVFAIMSAAG